MNAPKFYDVRLSGGPLVLCNACVAVLVQEGSVAGDPREEAVPASEVVRMAPRAVLPSDPNSPTCDTCSTREAYEADLNAARAEDEASARRFAAGYLSPHPCEDFSFGTPEEHARWHEVHDTPTASGFCDGCAFCNSRNIPCARCPACTPTFREVEGDDWAETWARITRDFANGAEVENPDGDMTGHWK